MYGTFCIEKMFWIIVPFQHDCFLFLNSEQKIKVLWVNWQWTKIFTFLLNENKNGAQFNNKCLCLTSFPKIHWSKFFVLQQRLLKLFTVLCILRLLKVTSVYHHRKGASLHSFLYPHFAILLFTGVFMNLLDFMYAEIFSSAFNRTIAQHLVNSLLTFLVFMFFYADITITEVSNMIQETNRI